MWSVQLKFADLLFGHSLALEGIPGGGVLPNIWPGVAGARVRALHWGNDARNRAPVESWEGLQACR